jgi:UDP-glucose 4-epimerase
VVAGFAPDAVVHLAAQADVQASIADPARDHAVNVQGTRAVAAAAAAAGAQRMISASSAAVYGEPAQLPLSETSPKRPMNPYGVSKLEAEAALAEALAGTGTDFASFRFANVYGPRQDGHGEGGVVAIFATRLVAGGRPVIYGTGHQTRDFIYVGDVVAAIIYALLSDDPLAGPAPDGSAYNISTGRESSVAEIAGILRMESMVLKEYEYLPARDGDVERSALDPAKALEVFGWTANQSLEAGLAMTWSYFRQTA